VGAPFFSFCASTLRKPPLNRLLPQMRRTASSAPGFTRMAFLSARAGCQGTGGRTISNTYQSQLARVVVQIMEFDWLKFSSFEAHIEAQGKFARAGTFRRRLQRRASGGKGGAGFPIWREPFQEQRRARFKMFSSRAKAFGNARSSCTPGQSLNRKMAQRPFLDAWDDCRRSRGDGRFPCRCAGLQASASEHGAEIFEPKRIVRAVAERKTQQAYSLGRPSSLHEELAQFEMNFWLRQRRRRITSHAGQRLGTAARGCLMHHPGVKHPSGAEESIAPDLMSFRKRAC